METHIRTPPLLRFNLRSPSLVHLAAHLLSFSLCISSSTFYFTTFTALFRHSRNSSCAVPFSQTPRFYRSAYLLSKTKMFGAPLVRATLMNNQRRPSISNLPPSSAVHAAIMSNKGSQSKKPMTQESAAAAKPASKYADVDPQMFIDSPFVGGATLSPTSSHVAASRSHTKSTNGSFDLRFFNPSDDPRLFAMHM